VPQRLSYQDLPPLEWIIDASERPTRWRGDMGRAEQFRAELAYLCCPQCGGMRHRAMIEAVSPAQRPEAMRPGDTLDDDPRVWTHLRRT
jgi:hypothetical protein